MNQDPPEVKQDNQCCQDPNCCTTHGTQPNKDRRTLVLRILVSVGVLLIAAGLTAYALIGRSPGQATDKSAVNDTKSAAAAAGRSVISDLNWVKKANPGTSGDSFTFALLPGEDQAKNSLASEQIELLAQQMEMQNKKISLFVLDRADPEYSTTVDRLLIRETPAAIGLNSSGSIAVLSNGITPEKLYEAYYISTWGCCPPSAGKCCGSN